MHRGGGVVDTEPAEIEPLLRDVVDSVYAVDGDTTQNGSTRGHNWLNRLITYVLTMLVCLPKKKEPVMETVFNKVSSRFRRDSCPYLLSKMALAEHFALFLTSARIGRVFLK